MSAEVQVDPRLEPAGENDTSLSECPPADPRQRRICTIRSATFGSDSMTAMDGHVVVHTRSPEPGRTAARAQTKVIAWRIPEILCHTQVALGRTDRSMAERQLDLL